MSILTLFKKFVKNFIVYILLNFPLEFTNKLDVISTKSLDICRITVMKLTGKN